MYSSISSKAHSFNPETDLQHNGKTHAMPLIVPSTWITPCLYNCIILGSDSGGNNLKPYFSVSG